MTSIDKFKEIERRVIVCMMHRGNASAKEIAELCGVRAHQVHTIKKNLSERGFLLARAPFINPYPLGYTGFTLFFSLGQAHPGRVKDLLEALDQQPGVSWIGKVGGEFDFAVAFLVRRVEEVHQTLHEMADRCGNVFAEKELLATKSFFAFVRKYFAPEFAEQPAHYFGALDTEISIDEIDAAILRRMSRGEYSSHREIARSLGIHHTLLERRLRNLEEAGVLSGYIHRFDFSALGLQTYRIVMNAVGINRKLAESLLAYAHAHPNILRFMETLGAWDYEFEIEVPLAEMISDIILDIRAHFGKDLLRLRLFQIFQHLKFSSFPFDETRMPIPQGGR